MGYNQWYKCYECLASNRKLYISHNVVFFESQFPFSINSLVTSNPTKAPANTILLILHKTYISHALSKHIPNTTQFTQLLSTHYPINSSACTTPFFPSTYTIQRNEFNTSLPNNLVFFENS